MDNTSVPATSAMADTTAISEISPKMGAGRKGGKKHRSGVTATCDLTEQKRTKLMKSKCVTSVEDMEIVDSNDEDSEIDALDELSQRATNPEKNAATNLPYEESATSKLPPEMPDWGIKLLEIMQSEFRSVARSIGNVEIEASNKSRAIKQMEKS